MTEKNILWMKYSTCIGLQQFLKGCKIGCREQWTIIKNSYENLRVCENIMDIQEEKHKLLFNCFLYAFCQNQFSIIVDHIAAIVDYLDLKNLKSEYDKHFKPFRVIANGMKHLNRSIKELTKKSVRGNIQFYNFSGSKITFGEASAECLSEEPLRKTEELFEKINIILSEEMQNLHGKIRKS